MRKKLQSGGKVPEGSSSTEHSPKFGSVASAVAASNRGSKYLPKPLKGYVTEIFARNRGDIGYPVFSVTNNGGFIPSEDYFTKQVFSKDTTNYKIVPPGAFAYNPSRINVGSIDYLRHDSPVLVSPLYIVFRTSQELHPSFLRRFILSESGLSQINHHTQGAVRDSLKYSGLEKVEIPVPPIDEQRKIAAVLEKADTLHRQRQESIGLTEKLLQSVFLDMFGDPAEQPQSRLVDLLNQPLRNGLSPASKGKYPGTVFTLSAITQGFFKSDSRKEAMFAAPPKPTSRVGKADFLICRGNGSVKLCGQGQFPTDDAIGIIFPDTIIAASIDLTRVSKSYFATLWNQPYVRKQLEDGARTANGIYKVNQTILENIQIPIADFELQAEFEKKAKLIISRKPDLESSAELTHALFSSLQQRAFGGELDLSRLTLADEVDSQAVTPVPENPTIHGRFKRPGSFITPPEIEDKMLVLEEWLDIGPGNPIPWSEDFFKYRTLSQVLTFPFSFNEIWEAVVHDIEDPSYEVVKAKVFEYIEAGILEQQFDMDRKEIVFYPRP